jgi:hypothetical protein
MVSGYLAKTFKSLNKMDQDSQNLVVVLKIPIFLIGIKIISAFNQYRPGPDLLP